MSSDAPSAAEALAGLVEQRERARAALAAIEDQQRAATAAVARASEELVAVERAGGSASEKKKVEVELAAARAKAAEPWGERAAGGRARVRDCDSALREFAAEHLDVLLAEVEAEGEAAASALDEAASALVSAYQRREEVSGRIGMLVSTAGSRIEPGGITRSRADQVASAAATLLREGGETPPKLRRDPRVPVLGAPVESVSAA